MQIFHCKCSWNIHGVHTYMLLGQAPAPAPTNPPTLSYTLNGKPSGGPFLSSMSFLSPHTDTRDKTLCHTPPEPPRHSSQAKSSDVGQSFSPFKMVSALVFLRGSKKRKISSLVEKLRQRDRSPTWGLNTSKHTHTHTLYMFFFLFLKSGSCRVKF